MSTPPAAPWREPLLAWYRRHARPLPWRRTHDPFRILVSEVMAQQTPVARAAPAWTAFVARFPTATVLADAPVADVLRAWRGLGYNRRAVNLHRAARTVADAHDGRVPAAYAELVALPGVGDYTAKAVLAFAFRRDTAPVDTNVARVLARVGPTSPRGRAELAARATALVPPGRGPEWSQALMDLGATVCLPRAPRCGGCPAAAWCGWRASTSRPDPAATAPVRPRPQGAFGGSDRYHRGRLLDALRRGRLPAGDLPAAAHLRDDPGRSAAIAGSLVRDGLAEWADGALRLPVEVWGRRPGA
ncbi:MAG: A/G-specific adenine glycosylase [Actinobacteria bacterium]|nr:A/G-specific adenine glycosylase [Actinomycetota bacterium]